MSCEGIQVRECQAGRAGVGSRAVIDGGWGLLVPGADVGNLVQIQSQFPADETHWY